jgi:hypothetical protein
MFKNSELDELERFFRSAFCGGTLFTNDTAVLYCMHYKTVINLMNSWAMAGLEHCAMSSNQKSAKITLT